MNYNDFNEETKLFLNKAMDIYSIIKNEEINQTLIKHDIPRVKQLSKLDKKVLSLFISGFIVDCNLKQIYEDYSDVKLNDLFLFIKLDKEQMKKLCENNILNENEYEEFYSKNFMLDIATILKETTTKRKTNTITPEIIVNYLRKDDLVGTSILEFFAEKQYGISLFNRHPLFNAVENYIKMKDFEVTTKEITSLIEKYDLIESENEIQNKIDFFDENIWSLLDDIKNKFIGQEKTVEQLFYNIINNQQLTIIDDIPNDQRSLIFLDGPTGTGKTAITKEISEKLKIPFATTSITNYSSTGYVGGDITDILKVLYINADNNLEKAQKGIIVLDEFDKIAYSTGSRLDMKKAVQQQLLDFLGGGKYSIKIGDKYVSGEEIDFDTSKLTFVCLGALTKLRENKTENKNTIGFGENNIKENNKEYSITPEDLVNIGLERELVGRLNTYLHTDNYSKESLIRILKESTISPLIGFKTWIESHGKSLIIDDEVYEVVADLAYQLDLGARGLQIVMNNIRTHFIKDVLRGTEKEISLNTETILEICNQTISRKGRL